MADVKVIRETILDPAFPLSRHELTELLDIILDSLGLAESTLVLKLVNDGEIARLNRDFMGCTGPTNVLSFPAHAEDGPDMADVGNGHVADTMDDDNFLGELALSVDALSRETALYGQPPVGHLARLLAHGILHLAGYDHGEEMYDLTDSAVDMVLLQYAGREEI